MKPLSSIIIKLTPFGASTAEDTIDNSPECRIISQLEMRHSMSARQAINLVGYGEIEGRALLKRMVKKKLITTASESEED